MSADKNHEQYLEQIETAVANTTMDILEKHSGDLRAMAKLVAEKQVEINRLKEFHNDDRNTIRNLRKLLKEATADADLYKKANLHEHTSCYDGRMMLVKTLWGDGKEYEDRIDLGFPKINEKIEELKEEIECRCSTWDTKEKEYEAEIAELKEEIKELKKGDKRKLKKKVEELEERLDEAWSEYNTEQEMRDTAEKELEELKDEQELMMLQGIHKVKELDKQIEQLKKEEIEKVFGVSKEVFEKLMKECPPDPDDYK